MIEQIGNLLRGTRIRVVAHHTPGARHVGKTGRIVDLEPSDLAVCGYVLRVAVDQPATPREILVEPNEVTRYES